MSLFRNTMRTQTETGKCAMWRCFGSSMIANSEEYEKNTDEWTTRQFQSNSGANNFQNEFVVTHNICMFPHGWLADKQIGLGNRIKFW